MKINIKNLQLQINIEEKIKKELEKNYAIVVDKIEKNEKSTDGNVFTIYSENSEKYFVKVYDNINHVNQMINIHTYLTKLNINIPKIIISNENKAYMTIFKETYIVVYSFIKEEQITYNLDDNTISNIAKMLYKIHTVTQGENQFKLLKIQFECKNNIERYSLLHFDLTKGNIFVDNIENNIGIIDFDDAKYGPSVYDVAIIIANLFFSKTNGVNIKGLNKFIDEYYGEKIELRNKEEHLIKGLALKWIDYILDNNEFDSSTTESFIVKRKLILEKYV